ncbi:hypothetical protein ACLOJK_006902 [Asimina triloba]
MAGRPAARLPQTKSAAPSTPSHNAAMPLKLAAMTELWQHLLPQARSTTSYDFKAPRPRDRDQCLSKDDPCTPIKEDELGRSRTHQGGGMRRK